MGGIGEDSFGWSWAGLCLHWSRLRTWGQKGWAPRRHPFCGAGWTDAALSLRDKKDAVLFSLHYISGSRSLVYLQCALHRVAWDSERLQSYAAKHPAHHKIKPKDHTERAHVQNRFIVKWQQLIAPFVGVCHFGYFFFFHLWNTVLFS